MSLFDFSQTAQKGRPLADRMRPRSLEEFLGQAHLVGKGRLLRRAIEADQLTSSIFYGPPGCGKTTLAYVISQTTRGHFERLNAVTSGVGEVREVIRAARERRDMYGQHTYLLLDECHRWSKAQSDSILPAIEEGLIRFIGSTTENPMIAMTPAIVSRCRVFQFFRLGDSEVRQALNAALKDAQRGLGSLNIHVEEEALEHWVQVAAGDVRTALNALELAALTTPTGADGIHITRQIAEDSIQKPMLRVDETLYYDMLSAFCKSLRGSDPDAALLWAARLLYAGCDPRLIVRRLIAHASEDVGLADPQALVQAVSAAQALEFVGLPEARLAITQAIIYICMAPKSNTVVNAMDASMADAERGQLGEVPVALRDTHYQGASRLGNGEGYLYPHDFPGHWVRQNYMPDGFEDRVYYRPGQLGFESSLKKKKESDE
ncbi:MAG TPA: replication-associated recombination protein A [Clostridia bacterium]|nr:replication-associated recombination protein A [Clostridia bacterium]HQO56200.1 replication-associated recombination protein A [Clostridia bacterium]HUM61620.1 replication-associated recombination protein A [Clostridia bacterium]